MKLGKKSHGNQEQPNKEIERSVPPEVEPLTNDEIPVLPDEYGDGIDSDTVTKDEYSDY